MMNKYGLIMEINYTFIIFAKDEISKGNLLENKYYK